MLQDYRQSKMEEMRAQMQKEIQERVDQLKTNPSSSSSDQAQGPFVPLLRCRVVDLMAPPGDMSPTATLTFWRPSEEIKSLMKEVLLYAPKRYPSYVI